jgi:large subunit ribosomal protein L21
MYAVIETGGKQYRVQPGQILETEKLEGEIGSPVAFNQVLFLSKMNAENAQVWLGKPYVSGASVQAEIVAQGRGEKVVIVKMKRRKQYRRTQGHRQYQTQLIVTAVDNGAGEKASMSDADKQAAVSKFRTQLEPKGPAFSQKILGSRKRLAAAAKAAAPAEAHAKKAAPAGDKPAKKATKAASKK